MMSKYYKNFILCGDVDHYCLLCEELFQSIPDVEKHIRWEKHRKVLKCQTYFPKYRKEFIYKVANKFYCEICNTVSSDIETLSDHINIETHKTGKINPKTETKNFIGQYKSGCVVINKVILSMAQWNSIVNKKCLLCNIVVRNIDEHRISEEHVIKLIQSETKYENERCYRKINKDHYHCFTCKKVFSAQNFNDHWPNCENIDDVEIDKLNETTSRKNVGSVSADTKHSNKMTGLEKQLIGTLQEFYYIEDQNNFATCKHCSLVVPINFVSMIEHMKTNHDNEEPKTNSEGKADHVSFEAPKDEVIYVSISDHGKQRSELAKYGKTHSIKLNQNGSKGWCLLCDRYISAHKNNFEQHVKGATHNGNLELQNPKNTKKHDYKTKSVLRCCLAYIPEEKQFWINNDCSIDVYSFFLLHQINDTNLKKTKCFTCVEMFPQGQELEHCETTKHKNNFMAAKFVMSIGPAEFIREIRPNFFHCGFCNQTFPFVPQLKKHLISFTHVFTKENNTDLIWNTIPIKTNNEDIYTKLWRYGFGKK